MFNNPAATRSAMNHPAPGPTPTNPRTAPTFDPIVEQRIVRVRGIEIGNERAFTLIAGPCAIESRAHALEMADALRSLSTATGVRVIYKSSFDKANRTSASAARGIGMVEGLAILAEVRDRTGLPVLTDVHSAEQCAPAA